MPLFSWLHERGMCTVFFAVAADGCMKVHDVREEKELVRGSLGVLEPDAHHCPQMDEALIDIALVPGLAFSQVDGLRLGRGKGCYDRVLARLRPDAKTIGIGFTLQMLPQVPAGPLDARVHSLLSEDGWINF